MEGRPVFLYMEIRIPKGLLRKIIREDLEMSLEDFTEQYSKFRGAK